MEPEINPTTNQNSLEINKNAESELEPKLLQKHKPETEIRNRVNDLIKDLSTGNNTEATKQADEIQTIDTPKYSIQINKTKLDEIKEKYEVSGWELVVEPGFTVKPNTESWKDKRFTFRPFNLWSYMYFGKSIKKRNERIPKALAHGFGHTQQDPIKNYPKYVLTYLIHPAEKDADEFRDEHWEEFKDIVVIKTNAEEN